MITYILLGLIFVVMGIFCIILMKMVDKYDDALNYMKNYTEMIIHFYKLDDDVHKSMAKSIDAISQQVDIMVKLTEGINDQYVQLIQSYNTLSDQHIKLLKAWEIVEARYSDCYDQYKDVRELLNALDKKNESFSVTIPGSTISFPSP